MKTKCQRCKGKGYIWVMVGEEPEKDMCLDCEGEGEIDDYSDDNNFNHDTIYDYDRYEEER